jgi:hypothetical protein
MQIFSPSQPMAKSLANFSSNAKKGSLRQEIAENLQSKFLPPTSPLTLPGKQKSPFANPYLDIWNWSCTTLEWGGPIHSTERVVRSHPLLPVLYHHFGCVPPTHDALHLITQLSSAGGQKVVIEIGSGGGYWTYMLRKYYHVKCVAVDDGSSVFRTIWIPDTIVHDGPSFVKSAPSTRVKNIPEFSLNTAVLLLVYPPAGGNFTESVLTAFEGSAIVVAGTQNGNGFTGFPKGSTVEKWMESNKAEFELKARIPLPSFAGKDEGLFVWVKKA